MIYSLALPNPEEPESLSYDPRVPTQKQTYLALWRTCKTIAYELPPFTPLLKSGAIKLTLDIIGSADTYDQQWKESLAFLKPYLPSTKTLVIQGPEVTYEALKWAPFEPCYEERVDAEALKFWRLLLLDWYRDKDMKGKVDEWSGSHSWERLIKNSNKKIFVHLGTGDQ